MSVKVYCIYDAESVVVDRTRWDELDRLSRDADPDSQAALNAFLDRHGRVASRARCRNLVPEPARNNTIDQHFGGVNYTAAWYVGLKATGAPASTDTMASHPTWTEITNYTQANRVALSLSAAAAGSANNSANRATFTAGAGGITVFGYFLSSSNAKGGTTGILFSASNFSSSRVIAAGAAERVQVTINFL
jgi:hypothetical protein